MEVQDNSNPNEVTPDPSDKPTIAVAGQSYPVRLLHLCNGMLIIGFVISVFPETTMVLRPYTVEPIFDDDQANITQYEFDPYLDQMSFFDAHDLVPVPFLNSSCISISRPALHMVQNYTTIVRLRERVKASKDTDELNLYKKEYLDPRTRH